MSKTKGAFSAPPTKEEITLDSIKQLLDDAAHWDNKAELIGAVKDTIEADGY
jgi:hypothetical protein